MSSTLTLRNFGDLTMQSDEPRGVFSLDQLPAGVEARVISVAGTGLVARRLMEMGVVPGAPVRFVKTAPLGDPLEIRVRGYSLALRRSEAQTITVSVSENAARK